MHKKLIIKRTIQIGSSTLTSRFLGIVRDLLMIRFLGVGVVSDAFTVAYRMPNTLRKIFAEGALSAAFIPLFLTTLRKSKQDAMSLMSLAFVLFEGILLVLCTLGIIFAPPLITFYAPGFSAEQTAIAVPLLRVLIPLIFFISSSALLAGALQSIGYFFVPAFGPILLNMVFIAGLVVCKLFDLPVIYLCFFILLGGLLQFLQHLFAYLKHDLSFGAISKETWQSFARIIGKFFLCALSMSVTEISIIIDGQFASFLQIGTVSLMSYAHKFMAIPVGVFAVAFSTILLPYFSRVSAYAPKRLNFFLYESAKIVFWVMIPCTFAVIFFANDIFLTIFVPSFTIAQAYKAGAILMAFGSGLFFFAFNKIILNVYYALHETLIPGIVSVIALCVNVIFNLLFIWHLGEVGLAVSTALSGACQTILLLYFLRKKFGFHGYLPKFFEFVQKYMVQLAVVGSVFLGVYFSMLVAIQRLLPERIAYFFLKQVGFWLWVSPLFLMGGLLLYLWRSRFGVRLYFLD